MSKIIIVNKKDEVIGSVERVDRKNTDNVRVSSLWIFNDNHEVLIAQRSHNKLYDPGKWGSSVAGTLEEGETYISNILKEAKEEIGLSLVGTDLILGPKRLPNSNYNRSHQSFFAKVNQPISSFNLQKEEVAELKLVKIDDLIKWAREKSGDFTQAFNDPESPLYSLAKLLK